MYHIVSVAHHHWEFPRTCTCEYNSVTFSTKRAYDFKYTLFTSRPIFFMVSSRIWGGHMSIFVTWKKLTSWRENFEQINQRGIKKVRRFYKRMLPLCERHEWVLMRKKPFFATSWIYFDFSLLQHQIQESPIASPYPMPLHIFEQWARRSLCRSPVLHKVEGCSPVLLEILGRSFK